jgi:phosphoenolpyruvate carboxylase
MKLAEKTGIPMYPIIGSASLPFRGGLTPYSVTQFINEYKGIKTALLQSAFRYDYPLEDVRKAIHELETTLQKTEATSIPKSEEMDLRKICVIFTKEYESVIEGIGHVINEIAAVLPKRRERVQHTGLFGYSRGVGSVKLPRAIGFTAALYSIGAPPEIIGTGRALAKIKKDKKLVTLLDTYFISFRNEMKRVSGYVNKKVIKKMAENDDVWKLIWEDVKGLEDFLGHEFVPRDEEEREHQKISEKIFHQLQHHSISPVDIEEAAKLRRSLG